MDRYHDRADAGRRLAEHLGHHRDSNPLVLGVPRGGVVVAATVVDRIGGDLDVIVARKLGAPGNPELAVGAVAGDGVPYVDEGIVGRLGVSAEQLQREAAAQSAEVRRREQAYRGPRPTPQIEGRTVIVVDDGVATGATLRVALAAVRRQQPRHLCCAVPVGPADTVARLAADADEVVCPLRPRWFLAVGEWYLDFRQVSDDEVVELLGLAA